jgi:parallel beta-helix repeat protein
MKNFIKKLVQVSTIASFAFAVSLLLSPGSAFAATSSILGTTGSSPAGIIIDSSGNIYVANYGSSNNVTKITPAGVSTILGTTDSGPYAITIDSVGNIYTANANSNNVSKITPEGVSTILGTTGSYPWGITIDSFGNIYTSNTFSNNVTKITPEGVSTILGTTGSNPTGITIDSSGNIYTANYANNVTKITPEGVSTILGTTGSNPYGITIDSSGNVYTANTSSNNVTKITPEGVSTILGTTGSDPWGITIDSSGNIYTANSGTNNVTKITPEGVSTINWATTGTGPRGITIDSSGNIYTTNFGSDNVSKITPEVTPLPLACGDTITSDTTLSADLNCSDTGLFIGADNITLDCAGHSITGPGIWVASGINNGGGFDGITIKNCSVSNFGIGLYFVDSSNSTITLNNTNSDGWFGIILVSGTGNNVNHNTVTNHYNSGIALSGSSNNTVEYNIGTSNAYGIYSGGSPNNLINNNILTSNFQGIYLQSTSDNTITNNTANLGGSCGILLQQSPSNTISSNTTNSNGVGIFGIDSNNNTISSNTANSNSVYGIGLITSLGNSVLNNLLSLNSLFDLFAGDPSVASGNTFTNNTGTSNLISNPDLDSDGIPNAIDRNSSGVDEKNTPSNNFNDTGVSGTTYGTITNRGTWNVTVEDLPAPAGVRVKIDGAGTGIVKIVSCSNNVESQLDATTETSDVTCGPTSGTLVKATQANTIVNVREPDSSVTTGTIIRVRLTTGQSVNMGSYVIAGADNTEPIVAEVFNQDTNTVLGSGNLAPSQALDISVSGTSGDVVISNIGTTPVTFTMDGASLSIAPGQTSTDQCPGVAGNVGGTGCPFAVKTVIDMQTVDQQKSGICGYDNKGKPKSECKNLLSGSVVRVFNREDANFVSLYKSKRPEKTKLDLIFEGGIGQVGTCTTDATGVCTVGTNTSGKYFMIAKYVDGVNTVYTGKYQNFKESKVSSEEEDGSDTDATVKNTLHTKKLHFIKTISKTGTVSYKAGTISVFTGSLLSVLYPESPVWEGATELYPFVMTSDSDWTVDVCLQVPAGYSLKGVQDVNGTVVSTSNCSQSLVSGTPVVVLFSLADIGSPEPTLGLSLTTTHKGKKTKTNVTLDGIRRKTKDAEEKSVKAEINKQKSAELAKVKKDEQARKAKLEESKKNTGVNKSEAKTVKEIDKKTLDDLKAKSDKYKKDLDDTLDIYKKAFNKHQALRGGESIFARVGSFFSAIGKGITNFASVFTSFLFR